MEMILVKERDSIQSYVVTITPRGEETKGERDTTREIGHDVRGIQAIKFPQLPMHMEWDREEDEVPWNRQEEEDNGMSKKDG